jgi:hypothetical protein
MISHEKVKEMQLNIQVRMIRKIMVSNILKVEIYELNKVKEQVLDTPIELLR